MVHKVSESDPLVVFRIFNGIPIKPNPSGCTMVGGKLRRGFISYVHHGDDTNVHF